MKKNHFYFIGLFYTPANPAPSCAQGNCFSAPRWLPEAGLLVPELIQYKIICQIQVAVEDSLIDESMAGLGTVRLKIE